MIRSIGIRLAAPLVVASLTTGCFVTKQEHDRTLETLRQEQEAHRTTADELAAAREQLAEAQTILTEAQQSLEAKQRELSQSKLDADVASTAREDATRLLDQLRGDLARVGDHLRAYSDQKSQLEEALGEAQAQAENLRRAEDNRTILVTLMRDVTLALHDPIRHNAAAVRSEGGKVLVSFETNRLFYPGKKRHKLTRQGASWLRALASAVAPAARSRLKVSESPKEADYLVEDVVVRMQSITDVLLAGGIDAARVSMSVPPESTGAIEPVNVESITDTEGTGSDRSGGAEAIVSKAVRRGKPGTVEVTIGILPDPSADEARPPGEQKPADESSSDARSDASSPHSSELGLPQG